MTADSEPTLTLGLEAFSWPDLHDPDGLARLTAAFEAHVEALDPDALATLRQHRADPDAVPAAERSASIVALAPHLGAFVARLFAVEAEVEAARQAALAEHPVFHFRKRFVKPRLLKPKERPPLEDATRQLAAAAWAAAAARDPDEERFVAVATLRLLDLLEVARKVARSGGASWTEAQRSDLAGLRAQLTLPDTGEADEDEAWLTRVVDAIEATLAARRDDAADPASGWVSLRPVHPQRFDRLVPLRRRDGAEAVDDQVGDVAPRERVEPFALTDDRGSRREVAAHVHDCLYCHTRGKDACSVGLRDKQGELKQNPLGVTLSGCPLDEKIGEAQALHRDGEILGALAAVTIDNPLCPGTGHRICNDCMKSCVFQTQEPVDVPRVETGILDDVLRLPWGFEIWSLLSRWSPLDLRRPSPRPYHGKKALVVGLGPAGYTLAHYLLNEGFAVVAIDGLKIEPLPAALVGKPGEPPCPIHDARSLVEPLERRRVLGFGGVSEYGITVRWDKSFLTMLYLNLARRPGFRAFGGVRFGGTIDLNDAWARGFDHVAIAAGAGRPNLVRMKDGHSDGLARGVRQASDFLMALQLSGAFRREALANLQLRLPAIVIGSGLTAIDTATEALAYYVVQAEKTLARYESLVAEHGEDAVRAPFDEEERIILDEALAHGRALREERERAAYERREPRLQELVDGWGGVRIAYRRRLVDSPAYRLNHEEVTKSLEEGVRYLELLSPVEVHVDRFGAVEAVTFERQEQGEGRALLPTGERVRLPARSVFVAAGTQPNVTYERERPGSFALDARGYFQTHAAARDGDAVRLTEGPGFFASALGPAGQTVSFYGDNHPTYAGSVVKAMASAKHGHRAVVDLFGAALDARGDVEARDRFLADLADDLEARVHAVRRLAPEIVEVVVRAPAAARGFEPGQFYRFQTYEAHAPERSGSRLTTEGIALTGAWTDPERGLLSMIVLEMGVSSRLCAHLTEGEPVVVMGPTGRPSEIAGGEDVLLVGGGLGNAVLFSIAKAFRAAGSRVLYFAGYRRGDGLFKREEIEGACDQVIWATDAGVEIAPSRPQDAHFRGNIVEAMLAYARGELGEIRVPLSGIDRVLAIGSDGMMNAVAKARHGVLAEHLPAGHRAIGSINSPMQCMMKEICAQCLQRHVDPETGEETLVYSCFDQDQVLDRVDFGHLRQRLRQSSMQEKLSDQWLAHLLS